MDSERAIFDTHSDPASAFDALRGEVSLLRRAVEGLTAERQAAPDYQPTLAAIVERLAAIEHSPAIQLTPEDIETRLAHLVQQANVNDRDTIAQTRACLSDSLGKMDCLIERAWTADRQNRWLLGTGVAGLVGGILLWSALPGIVARALPPNWHVPERVAARTIRLNMRGAGERLILAARQSRSKEAAVSPPNSARRQP